MQTTNTILAVHRLYEIVEADTGKLVAQSNDTPAGDHEIDAYMDLYDEGQLITRTRIFVFVAPASASHLPQC